jgi:thymidine kinase
MSLELIMGPMFSGKTSYVLSLVGRYSSIGKRVLVVNHVLDVRYTNMNEIVTHSGQRVPCYTTDSLNALTDDFLSPFDVIVIDEAQFFTGLVSLVEFVVDTLRKKLFLVGLNGDAHRMPFGELPKCIPLADSLTLLSALCSICKNGTSAPFTRRKFDSPQQLIVGGNSIYEPVCRLCYHK